MKVRKVMRKMSIPYMYGRFRFNRLYNRYVKSEENRMLHDDISKWGEGVSAEFLECMRQNHPKEYCLYYWEWEMMLRGD